MSSLTNFDYQGHIIQRREDGMVNLTQMCKAQGKRLDNWLANKRTKRYIRLLASSLEIQEADILQRKSGSKEGTWGHPSLGIKLAEWLNLEFEIWGHAHLFNLMNTGSTSLDIDPIAEMRKALCHEQAKKTDFLQEDLDDIKALIEFNQFHGC